MTISASARRHLETLRAAQPEAAPWLRLLATVLDEGAHPAWQRAARQTRLLPERAPKAPLLAGAEIPLDARHADRWMRKVLALAGDAGPEAASLRAAAASLALDSLTLLQIAINEDGDRLATMAIALGVPCDALTVASGLATLPLLQALRRQVQHEVDPLWREGYCPVCGGWPLLAELRGLERARRLRCGHCGGDWAQPGARCPFCDASGHGALGSLMPEAGGEARSVETCARCRGYLKAISTLRAWAGDEIALADLSTVEFDLAALERGYARPAPRLLEPGVRVTGDG